MLIFVMACQEVALDDVLAHLYGRSFNRNLGRCALVGGGKILDKAKHGTAIDAHDTVIRVNRLPGSHFDDLGRKCTVAFVNKLSNFATTHASLIYTGGKRVRCAHKKTCDCEAVIFEGSPVNVWSGHGPKGAKALREAQTTVLNESRGVVSQGHSVYRQTKALHYFEHNLPAVPYAFKGRVDRLIKDPIAKWGYTSKPSGGLKAFLTFVHFCSSLTLFGFGGTGSIDGHVEVGHNFKAEHLLFDKLANFSHGGNLFPTAFKGHFFKHQFASFQNRILCLAHHHRIRVVT